VLVNEIVDLGHVDVGRRQAGHTETRRHRIPGSRCGSDRADTGHHARELIAVPNPSTATGFRAKVGGAPASCEGVSTTAPPPSVIRQASPPVWEAGRR